MRRRLKVESREPGEGEREIGRGGDGEMREMGRCGRWGDAGFQFYKVE
jgi:hypothetical protein